MNLRGTLVIVLLAAAAVGTWLLTAGQRDEEQQETRPSAFTSGYYMLDATVMGTSEDGSVLYRLRAAEAAQAETGSPVELRDVEVRYSPAADIPWSLTADSGIIENSSRRLVLEGRVRAVSEPNQNGEVTELTTDYLEFDPRDKSARTDQRVTIRIGERSLSATGMLALLEEDRVELKSNVSGKFLP